MNQSAQQQLSNKDNLRYEQQKQIVVSNTVQESIENKHETYQKYNKNIIDDDRQAKIIEKQQVDSQFQKQQNLLNRDEDFYMSDEEDIMIIKEPQTPSSQIQSNSDNQLTFSQLHPASQKYASSSKLSLQYDIKLGWIPKAQITGPIPLAYVHPDSDQILMEKEDKALIIYYGPRFKNSFDIHRQFHEIKNGNQIFKKYPFLQFHLCKSKFLDSFFKKHYSTFEFDQQRKVGMIQPIRKQPETIGCQKVPEDQPLIFDSCFQGGNLDAVYYEAGQYRLFLRTDTNTRGHCNYFYFKVRSKRPGNFCFRIMNMSKPVSLYQRGLNPYIRINKNNKKSKWTQQGTANVRYGQSPLNEQYIDLVRKMYSLRFQYCFGSPNIKSNFNQDNTKDYIETQVQFCYGIPFGYSDLVSFLDTKRENKSLHLNKLCYSLSGVEIPLLTITDSDQKDQNNEKQPINHNKYVIAILGRVHPGQTHGSHIINGLINSLLSNSQQSKLLRTHLIFKIIPMLNPDGVIAGNTRTSFAGKDLNRVYSDQTDFVFPQIIGVRDYIKKLKQKYKSKFLMVIDIHGHSTRKNSFFFGPQYPVFDQEYNKCRLLPRIFANITEVFRYYSCKFRLAGSKQHTCRGYFNSRKIVRVYTHQTSIHSYFNFSQRKDTLFNQQNLQKLGSDLLLAFHNYVSVTLGIKNIQVPEPMKRKKIRIRVSQLMGQNKSQQVQQQATDSDDMGSDKADSQDSKDDYEPQKLQTFFNKINENKQYFYEQLLAQHKIEYKKKPKKKLRAASPKKTQKPDSPKSITDFKQIQLQTNLILNEDKKISKIPKKTEWTPKLQYINRKKQLVSYEKLANYVFQVPQIAQKQTEKVKKNKNKTKTMSQQKYNLIALQPLKNNDLGSQININDESVKIGSNKKSYSTHRFSLPTNSRIDRNTRTQTSLKKKILYDAKMVQQILVSRQPFIITQKQSNLTLSSTDHLRETLISNYKSAKNNKKVQYPQSNKFDLKTTSKHFSDAYISKQPSQTSTKGFHSPRKQLPRKKSIRSFKEQDGLIMKKLSRSKNNQPLTKKLPYLNKLPQNK